MNTLTPEALCEWLREHSSGVYRPAADAANLIEKLIASQQAAPASATHADVALQGRASEGHPWVEFDTSDFFKARASGHETSVLVTKQGETPVRFEAEGSTREAARPLKQAASSGRRASPCPDGAAATGSPSSAVLPEPKQDIVGRAALDEFCDKVCQGKPQLVSVAESAFYWFNKVAARTGAEKLERFSESVVRAKALSHTTSVSADQYYVFNSQGLDAFAIDIMDEMRTTVAGTAGRAADHNEAVTLLGAVFDAWENGDECYVDADRSGAYIGTAYRLDDDVFNRCCSLLNRLNPPRNAANAAPHPHAGNVLGAVGFTLDRAECENAEAALTFLAKWFEGDFAYVRRNYPDFQPTNSAGEGQ